MAEWQHYATSVSGPNHHSGDSIPLCPSSRSEPHYVICPLCQVDLRLNFIEQPLESGAAHQELVPVVLFGLDLVNIALDVQAPVFLEHAWKQIYLLAERCFLLRDDRVVAPLSEALKKLYSAKNSQHVGVWSI